MAHADAVPCEKTVEAGGADFGLGPSKELAVSRKCGAYDRKDACHAMPVRVPRQRAHREHASHLAGDMAKVDTDEDKYVEGTLLARADTKEDCAEFGVAASTRENGTIVR